jgi:hypothetical protein
MLHQTVSICCCQYASNLSGLSCLFAPLFKEGIKKPKLQSRLSAQAIDLCYYTRALQLLLCPFYLCHGPWKASVCVNSELSLRPLAQIVHSKYFPLSTLPSETRSADLGRAMLLCRRHQLLSSGVSGNRRRKIVPSCNSGQLFAKWHWPWPGIIWQPTSSSRYIIKARQHRQPRFGVGSHIC